MLNRCLNNLNMVSRCEIGTMTQRTEGRAFSVIVKTDGSFAALIMAARSQGRWRLYIILRRGLGKVMCPNAA